MSDPELRALERRWMATGSLDDEAAYLLGRVRVGGLTWERLELAAYCGHEGARRAVQASDGADLGPGTSDPVVWAEGLARWGKRSEVVGAIAVAEAATAKAPDGTSGSDLRAIAALGRRVLAGDLVALSQAADWARQLGAVVERHRLDARVGMRWVLAERWLLCAIAWLEDGDDAVEFLPAALETLQEDDPGGLLPHAARRAIAEVALSDEG